MRKSAVRIENLKHQEDSSEVIGSDAKDYGSINLEVGSEIS